MNLTDEEAERICQRVLLRNRLRRELTSDLQPRRTVTLTDEHGQPSAGLVLGEPMPLPQPATPAKDPETMNHAEYEFFQREQQRLLNERQNMQRPVSRFIPDPGPTTLADRTKQLRDELIAQGKPYAVAHDIASSKAFAEGQRASFARDCALGRVAPAPAPAAPGVPAANDVSTLLTDRRDSSKREFDALVAQGLTPEQASTELYLRSTARASGTALRQREQSLKLREQAGAPSPQAFNMHDRVQEHLTNGDDIATATSRAFSEATGDVRIKKFPKQSKYDAILQQIGLCSKQKFTEQVEKEHPTWDGRRVSEEADRRWNAELDRLVREASKLAPSGQLQSAEVDKQRSEELAAGLK